MGEHSEPKRVCRRNALAFLGCAAAFGFVASSAILTASQAEAQTSTTPTTPLRRPQIRRSLVRSGVRIGDPGALNGVRNGARGAQSDDKSDEQDAMSDGTRATVPPSRKSKPQHWSSALAGKLASCNALPTVDMTAAYACRLRQIKSRR